ncbi:hypothetical protein AMECASPLE_031077, partial [Ameca splendens]
MLISSSLCSSFPAADICNYSKQNQHFATFKVSGAKIMRRAVRGEVKVMRMLLVLKWKCDQCLWKDVDVKQHVDSTGGKCDTSLKNECVGRGRKAGNQEDI